MNQKFCVLSSAFLFFSWVILSASGCNFDEESNANSSDGTSSEIVSTAIGGITTMSEGLVSWGPSSKSPNFLAKIQSLLTPIPVTWAVPACNWYNNVTNCNANMETITFEKCSSFADPAISIQGSETLFWIGEGCCTRNPLSASSNTPCAFTRRTVNQAGISDPLIRSIGAHSLTLNTEQNSGYLEPKMGGFTVICQGSGTDHSCDGQRQVTIQGAHYSGQSGRARWDHTVSTDLPLIVQSHGADRKVLSGVVRTQHNLARFVSVTTVTSPLTYDEFCCFPSGGEISTSFIGGGLDGKTELLAFGPLCGEARLEGSDHKQSALTLRHCL